ncbi:serine/threonine-protein kinase [Nocardia harenae]|uniref:serine/threonine-protein kinase n=1 Tax=Nocardia harenae TaxID=358707 RepID=UPI000831486A|nr:serine/threonine-protein kinase [Nocardia harenae]
METDGVAHGTRTGTRFGPYELRSVLGCGGMGEVYEAFDTVKNRTVAVKLLSEELARDPVYQVRFRRESQAAARLADPHVVPIHDWGVIDGTLFLDMRLIAGFDLRTVLSRGGAMAPERAVGIIEQIAAALDAAHGAGLVHRDVKPSDILLTATDFAYLTDFGIAGTEGDAAVTMVGVGLDSYAYTAPERFDAGPVTAAADIYALACVLHECLTGVPPYAASTLNVLIRSHLTEPPPRPSLQRAGVPAGLDEVIARGLAKVPEERYAGALDLARAARAAVGGAAGSVRPAAAAPQSWFETGAAAGAPAAPAEFSAFAEPDPEPTPLRGNGTVNPFAAPAAGLGAGAAAAGAAGFASGAVPGRPSEAPAGFDVDAIAARSPGRAATAGTAGSGSGAMPAQPRAPFGEPGTPDDAAQPPAALRGTGTGPAPAPPNHSSTGGSPITPPGPRPYPGGPGRPPTGGHPIPRMPAETTPPVSPDSSAGPAEARPVVPAGTPVPNPATGATLVVRVPDHLLPESERKADATGEHKVVRPSGATEVRLGEVQFSLPPEPDPAPEPAPGSGRMRAFPDAHLYAGGQQYLPPERYQPPDATANETTQYIPPVTGAAPETRRYPAEPPRTPAAETTRYIPEQAYSAMEPAVDPSGYDRDNPQTEYLGPAGYAERGYDDGYPDQGYPDQGYPDESYGDQGYPDQGYGDQGYGGQGHGDQGHGDRGYDDDPYGAYDPYGPQDPDGYPEDGYDEEPPKPRSRARSALGPVLATVVVLLAIAVVGTIGWQRFAGGDSAPPAADGPNVTAVAPTAGLTGAAAPTGPATTTRPDPTTTTAPRSSTTTSGASSTTSASRTSTTSATTSAGAVSLPAGASPCDQGSASTPYSRTATGSGVTTCGFAEAVQEAYSAAGGTPQSVEAISPVTGRRYTMNCTPDGEVVTCIGGDNAVVYVY